MSKSVRSGRRTMLKAVNRVNDTRHPVAQRSSLGPTVTRPWGISDDHSLTVLVQSSSPLESVDADLVEHGQVTSTHPLHIVSRYSRDGNSFLLAVFYSEEPLTPAVQVRLRSGSKTVSCESSRTHQTVDSTYPLIDRHHLITEIDGFRIESGMPPRAIWARSTVNWDQLSIARHLQYRRRVL